MTWKRFATPLAKTLVFRVDFLSTIANVSVLILLAYILFWPRGLALKEVIPVHLLSFSRLN